MHRGLSVPFLVLLLSVTAVPTGSALNVNLLKTYDGTVTSSQFAVACAVGDMDGDGFAEFAVGASSDSTAGRGAGRVFIYRGGPGLPDTPAWVISGQPGDLLGASLAAARDIDGDGYQDLIIGAPGSNTVTPNMTGRVLIVFGSNPLGARAPLSIPGTLVNSKFGASVAGLGGFNGDGFADFAVGAPQANGGTGDVAVFLGGNPVSATPLFVLHGAASGDNFGAAIAGAGATRGSFGDLLVGAPYNSEAHVWAGKACLYLGGALPDAIADRTWLGQASGDLFGSAVASAGDVNGDGLSDFLIGAPEANVGLAVDAGRAYLYLGAATPPLSPALTMSGSTAGAELGFAVQGIGDVNHDSRADFAVGVPCAQNCTGSVQVFLGRAVPASVPDTVFSGEATDDQFGYAISNGGRIFGVPPDLFIVGSYSHGGTGRAYVYGPVNVSGVPDDMAAGLPKKVRLSVERAFGRASSIRLELDDPGWIDLTAVDVQGRLVATLAHGTLPRGPSRFAWPPPGTRVPSGMYWAVLKSGGGIQTSRLLTVER